MTTDITDTLRHLCTDVDGSPMPDGVMPDNVFCFHLREAAAEIDSLRLQLSQVRGAALEEVANAIGSENTSIVTGAGSEDYWRGCFDTQRAAASLARSLIKDAP